MCVFKISGFYWASHPKGFLKPITKQNNVMTCFRTHETAVGNKTEKNKYGRLIQRYTEARDCCKEAQTHTARLADMLASIMKCTT